MIILNLFKTTMDCSVYSSFKFSAEKLIQNYCKSKNIDFYIMRLFNTYGNENTNFH